VSQVPELISRVSRGSYQLRYSS